MTIISSSIKQQQLIMEFYKQLFSKSMKRDALYNICLMLVNTIKNNAIYSSYKSCAEMLRANNIPADNKEYKLAFTALKKLGIILKHNNRYLLNPAVEANYTSRRYELIIGYYNLLFGETAFELLTLDELRQLAVSSYTADIDKRNQLIEENNYLYEKFGSPRFEYMQPIHIKSYDQLYQLAFNTAKPKSLSTYDKPIYKAINEAYRNVCTNQATKLFIEHIRILEEQGIVDVQWGGKGTKTNYTFHKFTLKAQKALISYDQTNYYLDNLPIPHEELAAQLFEDTQQQLQLQFEEEDISSTLTFTTTSQQQLDKDKSPGKNYRAIEASLAAKQSSEHTEELRQHNELMYQEYLDGEKRYGKPVFNWESNIPIQEPSSLTEEQKDLVSLIRKEGRFPTDSDNLPIDIHIELCTEAHSKWVKSNNIIPDKDLLVNSIFSSISTC